jgi:hypothetical protein
MSSRRRPTISLARIPQSAPRRTINLSRLLGSAFRETSELVRGDSLTLKFRRTRSQVGGHLVHRIARNLVVHVGQLQDRSEHAVVRREVGLADASSALLCDPLEQQLGVDVRDGDITERGKDRVRKAGSISAASLLRDVESRPPVVLNKAAQAPSCGRNGRRRRDAGAELQIEVGSEPLRVGIGGKQFAPALTRCRIRPPDPPPGGAPGNLARALVDPESGSLRPRWQGHHPKPVSLGSLVQEWSE